LLAEVNQSRTKPLLVKMPPYKSDEGDHEKTLNLGRICLEEKVESLTVSNTIPIAHDGLAVGHGGLSGNPLFENTLAMVKTYHSEFGDSIEINACGGISNGYQAYEALKAGASSIQILTALIYQGPRVVQKINKELSELITNKGNPKN
ncbi:MAG TPA: quinone-dependent dihydroorotate dehydrogenase, partial [SAR202 cluster bacterium]|nr:quinone-dependent dihydroorotate dehydrogenase [SAR202 cluster bacterium]